MTEAVDLEIITQRQCVKFSKADEITYILCFDYFTSLREQRLENSLVPQEVKCGCFEISKC